MPDQMSDRTITVLCPQQLENSSILEKAKRTHETHMDPHSGI